MGLDGCKTGCANRPLPTDLNVLVPIKLVQSPVNSTPLLGWPLADERTNKRDRPFSYGMALHTLTPEGRGYVRLALESSGFTKAQRPESLAAPTASN